MSISLSVSRGTLPLPVFVEGSCSVKSASWFRGAGRGRSGVGRRVEEERSGRWWWWWWWWWWRSGGIGVVRNMWSADRFSTLSDGRAVAVKCCYVHDQSPCIVICLRTVNPQALFRLVVRKVQRKSVTVLKRFSVSACSVQLSSALLCSIGD